MAALCLSSPQPPEGPAYNTHPFPYTGGGRAATSLCLPASCSWPSSAPMGLTAPPLLPLLRPCKGPTGLREKLPSLKVHGEWAGGPLSLPGPGQGWPLTCWPLWQQAAGFGRIHGSTLSVPLPVTLGPIPPSLCFPAALRSFPDLWAHVASSPHFCPEPHLPAESTARPCPLPCSLLTPRPGLSSGAGKRAGTRQQTEALASGTKPGCAGVHRG